MTYLAGLIVLLWTIFFSCSLIVLYKILKCYYYPNIKDPLLEPIIGNIDGWTLSHFFYFSYLGALFPTYIYELLLLSIYWELFEEGFGLIGLVYNDLEWIKVCLEDDHHPGRWWYGKKEDILANMLGLFFGLILRYL